MTHAPLLSRTHAFRLFLYLLASAATYSQVVEWTRQFGATGTDSANAVAASGSAVYTARSATNAAFPGATNAGKSDAFVTKLYLVAEIGSAKSASAGFPAGSVQESHAEKINFKSATRTNQAT